MANTKEEAEVMRTDALIQRLSSEAGQAPTTSHAAMPFGRALGLGLALALVAALLVVIGLSEIRTDLPAILPTWVFQFKVVAMVSIILGGISLVRAAGIPGAPVRPVRALLPGILFLLAGLLLDRTGFPLLGVQQFSAARCVAVIVAASLPGLALILAGLRRGIPTRLSSAGAVAGILAGSLAALVYTVACVNDGTAFVAIWYVVAISITAAAGAIAGRHALAW
ncbi:NrsF family protein [Bordetella genomosp. 13]|uniref:NrsF family protein n=1 Tax=Bordetella genomosp. 13 TaxID=463040 RepID=UPI00119ED759|nr:NrsF family protein [Bordetella genomosp. 13]